MHFLSVSTPDSGEAQFKFYIYLMTSMWTLFLRLSNTPYKTKGSVACKPLKSLSIYHLAVLGICLRLNASGKLQQKMILFAYKKAMRVTIFFPSYSNMFLK